LDEIYRQFAEEKLGQKSLWGIHLFTVILSAKDALAQKYPAMTALY